MTVSLIISVYFTIKSQRKEIAKEGKAYKKWLDETIEDQSPSETQRVLLIETAKRKEPYAEARLRLKGIFSLYNNLPEGARRFLVTELIVNNKVLELANKEDTLLYDLYSGPYFP